MKEALMFFIGNSKERRSPILGGMGVDWDFKSRRWTFQWGSPGTLKSQATYLGPPGLAIAYEKTLLILLWQLPLKNINGSFTGSCL